MCEREREERIAGKKIIEEKEKDGKEKVNKRE